MKNNIHSDVFSANAESSTTYDAGYSIELSSNNSCNGYSTQQNDSSPFEIIEEKHISISSQFTFEKYCQDGCIWGDFLFLFNSEGKCKIYNLLDGGMISEIMLPRYNGLVPHCNSACFGEKYYDSDYFPLLYLNVYNNYPDDDSSYGMCFVYRVVYDSVFLFNIAQVLKIGFVNDISLWYASSDNESPFGNFIVNDGYLWVYLNIFGANITRFFRFELPIVNTHEETIVFRELLAENILETFDTSLFKYIQGGTTKDNCLLSLEGSGTESVPGFLRIINLETKLIESINLNSLIGSYEPESISVYNSLLLIGTYQGEFFCISI